MTRSVHRNIETEKIFKFVDSERVYYDKMPIWFSAGGDDAVGRQGRGREGGRPGVHLDDDGGDEETDGKPTLRKGENPVEDT